MDWVTKRYECSLKNAFQKLREVVDSDVKSVSKISRPGVTVVIASDAPKDKIIVDRSIRRSLDPPESSSVVFDLMADEIRVRTVNPDKPLFSAKPRLNREGDCLLCVTGESELQQIWQVSQKALDDLFFGF